MMTVGEIVIKLRASDSGLAEELEKAKAEMDAFADSTDKSSGGMAKWGDALKIALPIGVGLGVAVLGLTGNLGSLSGVLPVITTGLGLLLAPLTSVAAIFVALIGPVSTVVGLLGVLGAAFGFAAAKAFGSHEDGLGKAIAGLDTQFKTLVSTLVGRFMPVWRFLISSASDALGYFNKLAHMSLGDAFKSLSTVGVAGLKKFLDQVGSMLAHPIRLAFKLAFGSPGQGVSNALGGIWDQIIQFFRKAPKGGVSIDTMMSNWFGAKDFTKTGLRWGMELAGAIIDGLGQTMKHTLGSRGIGFLFGGALAGAGLAAAFGPVGIGAGAALGAGIGLALNHYWPKIVNGAKHAWTQISTSAVAIFHQITSAIEKFLGPTTWNRIGTIAKNVWNTIRMVAVSSFHIIESDAKTLWNIFDVLVIKSGAWKVALALVKGAIYIIVDVLTTVSGWVKTIIKWVVELANHFNDYVLSAVQAVASVVGTIASDIETAVGWATKLASALGGIGNTGSGAGPGYGGAHGGPRHSPAPGSGTGGGGGGKGGKSGAAVIELHFHGGIGDRQTARRVARELAPHLNAIVSVRG